MLQSSILRNVASMRLERILLIVDCLPTFVISPMKLQQNSANLFDFDFIALLSYTLTEQISKK